MTRPVAFRWDGESMAPLRPKQADREYTIGDVYWLAPPAERSTQSHNHQFAWLADAFLSLPERIADQFHSPEHLRKAALIDAGFYIEKIVDAGSNAAALRVAALMREDDEFARVVVRGPLVVRRRAKSQKRSEMSPKEFQQAKEAVLEIVAAMIGVQPETLSREAGKAA